MGLENLKLPHPHFINRGPCKFFITLGIIEDKEDLVDSPFSIFVPKTNSPFSVCLISKSSILIPKLFAKPIAALVGTPLRNAEVAFGPFLNNVLSSARSTNP